jgi:hypothetical protein
MTRTHELHEQVAQAITGLTDYEINRIVNYLYDKTNYIETEDLDELEDHIVEALGRASDEDFRHIVGEVIKFGGELATDELTTEDLLKCLIGSPWLSNSHMVQLYATTLKPGEVITAIYNANGYPLIETNSHGYVLVSKNDPHYNDALDVMSKYSYHLTYGNLVLGAYETLGVALEEDVDASNFFKVIKSQEGNPKND